MQIAEETTLRILMVEDMPHEAELVIRQLRRDGLRFEARRVETEDALRIHLIEYSPDVILSGFNLPQFDGISALRVAREMAPAVPFIFVSGTIGEERAIDALRAGAADYVLKQNLLRLGPAVERALAEAELRQERLRQEEHIARQDRVLAMLSGINALVVRARDRSELLNETCRLAVRVGGYLSAAIYLKTAGTANLALEATSGSEVFRETL